MSKMSMQNFAVFGKIRNLWECETGWNRIPGTEELCEKRKYQNEKEDILRIMLNDERDVVLPIQKRELHGIDAFGDTGLYMEKDLHSIEMRRENIREKMRKGKMALEICVCGKEAA